jgi:flagellar motor switch protein FliM
MASITKLHEGLARRLSNSLSAHFRVTFQIDLVSVEQMVCEKLLARISDPTYFASIHVMPLDARAAIQMDSALTYAIVDATLGGSGSGSAEVRDLTDIDEQILQSVVGIVLADLHTVLAPILDLDFQFEQRHRYV